MGDAVKSLAERKTDPIIESTPLTADQVRVGMLAYNERDGFFRFTHKMPSYPGHPQSFTYTTLPSKKGREWSGIMKVEDVPTYKVRSPLTPQGQDIAKLTEVFGPRSKSATASINRAIDTGILTRSVRKYLGGNTRKQRKLRKRRSTRRSS